MMALGEARRVSEGVYSPSCREGTFRETRLPLLSTFSKLYIPRSFEPSLPCRAPRKGRLTPKLPTNGGGTKECRQSSTQRYSTSQFLFDCLCFSCRKAATGTTMVVLSHCQLLPMNPLSPLS